MTVKELAERSAKFVKELENHIAEVVNDNPILIDLNKKQLKQSIKATGEKITPRYSRSYASFKGFQYPDLRLTGNFYAGMYIKYDQQTYTIDSEDDKTNSLVNRYSPQIFGIAKENQQLAQKVTSTILADIYRREVLS